MDGAMVIPPWVQAVPCQGAVVFASVSFSFQPSLEDGHKFVAGQFGMENTWYDGYDGYDVSTAEQRFDMWWCDSACNQYRLGSQTSPHCHVYLHMNHKTEFHSASPLQIDMLKDWQKGLEWSLRILPIEDAIPEIMFTDCCVPSQKECSSSSIQGSTYHNEFPHDFRAEYRIPHLIIQANVGSKLNAKVQALIKTTRSLRFHVGHRDVRVNCTT